MRLSDIPKPVLPTEPTKTLGYFPKQYVPDWETIHKQKYLEIISSLKDRYATEYPDQPPPSEASFKKKATYYWFRWLAKNDLYWLSRYVLGHKNFSLLHYYVCGWLYDRREEEELAICLPRGCFKSTILRDLAVQLYLRDPTIRMTFIVSSDTYGSINLIKELHKSFTNPILNYLFPEIICATNKAEAKKNYDKFADDCLILTRSKFNAEASGATVDYLTAGSSGTGYHFDVAFIDDGLVHELNYTNANAYEKAAATMSFITSKLDKQLKNIGPKYYHVFTPYAHNDYNWSCIVPKMAGSEHINKIHVEHTGFVGDKIIYLPAYFDNMYGKKVYIFPDKFGEHNIDKEKLSYGVREWNSQVRLQPTATEEAFFQEPYTQAVRCIKIDEDGAPMAPTPMNICIIVDQAGESKTNYSDESVIMCMGLHADGVIRELGVQAGNWRFEEFVRKILAFAQRAYDVFHPIDMVIATEENNFIRISDRIVEYINTHDLPWRSLRVKRTPHDGKKFEHMKNLQMWWDEKKILLHPEDKKIMHQITQYPQVKHDDRIDCAAHVCRLVNDGKLFMPEMAKPLEVQILDNKVVQLNSRRVGQPISLGRSRL